MTVTSSVLCRLRQKYQPKLPKSLRGGVLKVGIEKGESTTSISDEKTIKKLFPNSFGAPTIKFKLESAACDNAPLRIGVVLSGGQAPGGHNVIAGIFDGVKSVNKDSRVLGFLGGPAGLVNGKFIEISAELMDQFRNSGGFDIIGSGRTKLETNGQFDQCIELVKKERLDCIVIIGGDDSNTNAAVLAEYFKAKRVACAIIGCPKTIDGDLKNQYVETPFGFDTAVKTYAGLIGNIARDANSAKKYWHFIKIMGRSATHIGLEAALQTRPNYCIISEEVEQRQMTLKEIVKELAQVIEERAAQGKNFGVALIPEGLIEFIPEIRKLIGELNDAMAHNESALEQISAMEDKVDYIAGVISDESARVLNSLPALIQKQLLLERDPHGNVQVSLIETEKLLIEMVAKELRSHLTFKGKFATQSHFFGYEGRSAHPSNFDADYGYGLGYSAVVLAKNGMTGYMSSISNLARNVDEWVAGGIPTTMLMNMERRHGEDKPVIQKALVDLMGPSFRYFVSHREEWAKNECYLSPGAIQYFGPSEICDAVTKTLVLESGMELSE